jgi:hypothetical protein
MTQTEKVFCSQCRYFQARGQIEQVCYHPHAVEVQEDWHGRRTGRASAAIRNQRNDCADFTPSRWWVELATDPLGLLGLGFILAGVLGLLLW